MTRHIALTFENDKDAERFLGDVKKFGSVPIPDGRSYGEYPCTARDITPFMNRMAADPDTTVSEGG